MQALVKHFGLNSLAHFHFFLLYIFNMSLQRVLEIARKNGMPVIITDNSGLDPMVILPLEQFEALIGGEKVAQGGSTSNVLRPTIELDPEPSTQDAGLDQAIAEMTAERLKSRVEEAAVQLEDLAKQAQENPEISLEERFYLEPLEDE